MENPRQKLIEGLVHLLTTKELGNNVLVLVTPVGLISGKPADSSDILIAGEEPARSMLTVSQNEIMGTITHALLDPNTEYSEGAISLKDVSIQVGTTVFKLPFLTVFFDQIIGITIKDGTGE